MSDSNGWSWRRWAREPLVHFVVLGALIFAIDASMPEPEAPDQIVVSTKTVESLRDGYERRHGAAPDEEQTRRLIDQHVREEVLYREGLALGLHRSDPIVRRRMIQATRFLSEDLAPIEEPSDEQLRSYLEQHPEAFAKPARVSLQHIFFGGEDASERAEAALDKVRGEEPTGELGDAFVHGSSVEHADRQKLAGRFGDAFARRALALEPGTWSEPIPSKYGSHLVYVDSRLDAGTPSLDEVRHAVRVAWEQAARERANREALDRLVGSYEVRVEWEGPQ